MMVLWREENWKTQKKILRARRILGDPGAVSRGGKKSKRAPA